jgi:hypothetical protein
VNWENHQHASFRFAHGAVHFAAGILKHSQAHDFASQIIRVGFVVIPCHAKQYQQSWTDRANYVVADADPGPAYSLHHGAHGLLRRFRQQGLLAGDCEPALAAIDIDVGESDSGHGLALPVHQGGQSTDVAGIAEHMGREFAQDIPSGTAAGNLGQSFRPIMKLAVGIGILKFGGENAADGIRIAHFERLCPRLLDLDEGVAVLGVVGWAVGCEQQIQKRRASVPAHHGQHRKQDKAQAGFHVCFPG